MNHCQLLTLALAFSALAGCTTPPKPPPPDPLLISVTASRARIVTNHIAGDSKDISKADLQRIMAIIDRRPYPEREIFEIMIKDRNHVSISLRDNKQSDTGPCLEFRRTSKGWVVEDDPNLQFFWIF